MEDATVGEEQAAKLNTLLDEIAKRLIEQGKRIEQLEAVVRGQQELLSMAGAVLHGHQAVFEANGLDAVKVPKTQPQPRPTRGVN